jgi:hypothetical protein
VGYGKSHRSKLLLHLPTKDEGALVEQDVTTLTVDPGKEHRFDQTATIIESHKFHRLVGFGMHRLGRRKHAGG